MPIGKNSIKRVANNGYSNVKSTAPDMENSTVLANPSPEVIEKMIPSSKTIAPEAEKKTTTKKAPAKKSATAKKSTATKPKAAAKPAAPVEEGPTVSDAPVAEPIVLDDGYVNLGEELPTYLL